MVSAHRVFMLLVLLSCASYTCTLVSLVYFLITSLHRSFSLPIFPCVVTSISRVLITTYSYVFLSTWPNNMSRLPYFLIHVRHTCPCSYLFIPGIFNHIPANSPAFGRSLPLFHLRGRKLKSPSFERRLIFPPFLGHHLIFFGITVEWILKSDDEYQAKLVTYVACTSQARTNCLHP